MRFGSVCSGIEAASVAWNPLGLEAAWVAEIEPFPCAVLAHHYPDVPNLGDMLDSVVVAGDVMVAIPSVTERILIGEVEAPDALVGGTPCQAFSVAGLRLSLDDARGNLTLTFCEIADAIDAKRIVAGREPCIVFWENVPGVLNTSDNAFGCFLGKLAGEDCPLVPAGEGWPNAGCVIGPVRTIAWRVLDAQYFGLAQRRKRVFVVASARIGFDPVEILFIEDGVRGNTPPSREAGQGTSISPSLRAQANSSHRLDSQAFVADVAASLDANYGRLQGCSGQDAGHGHSHLVAHSLRGEGFDASEDGTGRGTPLVCVHGTQDPCIDEHVAFALGRNNGGENVIGFSCKDHGAEAVASRMQVRRLTPRECERLQGFPDDYTKIAYRKKPPDECPDGPRYKALGNSWAVRVVRWIGRRILNHLLRLN